MLYIQQHQNKNQHSYHYKAMYRHESRHIRKSSNLRISIFLPYSSRFLLIKQNVHKLHNLPFVRVYYNHNCVCIPRTTTELVFYHHVCRQFLLTLHIMLKPPTTLIKKSIPTAVEVLSIVLIFGQNMLTWLKGCGYDYPNSVRNSCTPDGLP